MEKVLRMDESIYDMVSRHPEVIEIMVDLGFKDIAKPGMLQTAGRFMTLSKGIKLKKIDLGTVKLAFERHGFEIVK
jgi:selenophosphate synthetase-related protein